MKGHQNPPRTPPHLIANVMWSSGLHAAKASTIDSIVFAQGIRRLGRRRAKASPTKVQFFVNILPPDSVAPDPRTDLGNEPLQTGGASADASVDRSRTIGAKSLGAQDRPRKPEDRVRQNVAQSRTLVRSAKALGSGLGVFPTEPTNASDEETSSLSPGRAM